MKNLEDIPRVVTGDNLSVQKFWYLLMVYINSEAFEQSNGAG